MLTSFIKTLFAIVVLNLTHVPSLPSASRIGQKKCIAVSTPSLPSPWWRFIHRINTAPKSVCMPLRVVLHRVQTYMADRRIVALSYYLYFVKERDNLARCINWTVLSPFCTVGLTVLSFGTALNWNINLYIALSPCYHRAKWK